MSGDAHIQQSGSLNDARDDNEKVMQPKLKRKRSMRVRPQPAVRRLDNKSVDRSSLLHGQSSHLPFQADRRLHAQSLADQKVQADRKLVQENNAYKHEQSNPSLKAKRTPPARKTVGQPTRTNPLSGPSEKAREHFKERPDVKVKKGSVPFGGTMMTEAVQRRVCIVIN